MPFVTAIDGTSLYYHIHGTGPNEVMLLHGMGSSSIWKPMLDHLDRDLVRTVAFDWRGHGRSAGSERQFSYPQFNDDILAVARAVGFSRSVIIGFSGGCKNAVWLAARNPERVRGLVLVAPPGLGIVPLPREMIAVFFDVLGRGGELPREFDPWFTEKMSNRSAVIDPIAATPRRVLDASAELWVYTSITHEVSGLSTPVLVVAGAREPVYHPEFQRETTLATLPNAKMEVLDCAHFIPHEEPAALSGLITRFVATLPTGDGSGSPVAP
jgi:pimeloyl-ACP methyl ester carboxylesterase